MAVRHGPSPRPMPMDRTDPIAGESGAMGHASDDTAPPAAAAAATAEAAGPSNGSRRASSSSCGAMQPQPPHHAAAWDAVPDGATYALPVDCEHKATRLALLSFARPHMRAFHLSWLAFFACFFSTFAAAAVLPVVREELNLTQTDVGYAGIASVVGAVGSRVAMGWAVDVVGPRISAATLLLLTAPSIFGMALIQTPAAFIALRAVIGLNLSMFVVNQYWVSAMFNTRILGSANALSAGWGNMGGGVAMLVMTALVEGIARTTPPQQAWRWALMLPGALQVLAGAAVLFASDDCPLGRRPPKRPPRGSDPAGNGNASSRTPVQVAPRAGRRNGGTAGASVASPGAPSSVDFDSAGSYARAALAPGNTSTTATALANGKVGGKALDCVPTMLSGCCCSSSCSGTFSYLPRWIPVAALNYRTYLLAIAYAMSFGVELTVDNVLTTYFFDQFDLGLTAAGLISSIYGLMNVFTRAAGGWASDVAAARTGMRGRLWVLFIVQLLGGITCVLVGVAYRSLLGSILAVVVFSVFTQAACGAVFGIVPFLSHRSPGFAMGVVASGGNVGSAVMQAVFFTFYDLATHQGFFWMGITVVILSGSLLLVHFPQWGGMLCRPHQGSSEESYYLAEWSQAERAEGLHLPALAFAYESKSERGKPNSGDILPVASLDAAAALSGRVASDGGAAALCLCCAPRPNATRAQVAAAPLAARDAAGSLSMSGGGGSNGAGTSGRDGQVQPVTQQHAFLELSSLSATPTGISNGASSRARRASPAPP